VSQQEHQGRKTSTDCNDNSRQMLHTISIDRMQKEISINIS